MYIEKKIQKVIPYIPILYLIVEFATGFVYKIFFGVFLLICLFYNKKISKNKINIAIVSLLIYFVIHFFVFKNNSIIGSILLIYNSFVLLSIVNLIKKEHIIKISQSLFFLGIFLITVSFYEALTGNYHFLINPAWAKVSDLTGLNIPLFSLYNPNDLAYYLVGILPFSIYTIIVNTKHKIFAIIYVLLTCIIGYFAESVFAVIVSLGYFTVILISSVISITSIKLFVRNHKKKLLFSMILLLSGIIILLFDSIIKFIEHPIFSGRFILIQQALDVISNNLWLGVGVGNAGNYMYKPPHNLFLNIGVATGIIGMIPLIFIYINLILVYLKNSYRNIFALTIEHLLGFSTLLFFITNMMSSGSERFGITWLFLGLSIVVLINSNNFESPQNYQN
ncbi:MAG: O-antigen ligase family protein [Culicoidibacterales bacterium]